MSTNDARFDVYTFDDAAGSGAFIARMMGARGNVADRAVALALRDEKVDAETAAGKLCTFARSHGVRGARRADIARELPGVLARNGYATIPHADGRVRVVTYAGEGLKVDPRQVQRTAENRARRAVPEARTIMRTRRLELTAPADADVIEVEAIEAA
jgi:hypothetical protein